MIKYKMGGYLMKKYIVYDDYKIGYIKDICTCKRGRAEVFINDLDDNYLDCVKINDFDRIYDKIKEV